MSIYRKPKGIRPTLAERGGTTADNRLARRFVENPDLGSRDGGDGHPVPKVRASNRFSDPNKRYGVSTKAERRGWKGYREHQPRGMGRDGRFTDRRIPWWDLPCVEPSTEPPTLPDPEPNLEI